jgi:hypothetical protein
MDLICQRQVSDTHDQLLEVLSSLNFNLQEFILSPLQFGVPYSRPRYFCLVRTFEYFGMSRFCLTVMAFWQPLFLFLFAYRFLNSLLPGEVQGMCYVGLLKYDTFPSMLTKA